MIKNPLFLLSCFLIFVGAFADISQAAEKKQDASAPKPQTVKVVNPVQAPVTDFLDLNGTVEASQTVDLVARVAGVLESVDFKPGSYVEKGDLLFTIEPDTYQQEVNLNRAQLKRMQEEYERQLRMIEQNATSQSSVEQYRAQRDQALANTKLAEINLGYTKIKAPFDGRIGRNLVDPGNLVGYGQPTKLATIEKIAPAYIYFNVNERDILQIRQAMEKQNTDPEQFVNKLPVQLALQNETGYPHTGTLDFIDTTVTTDTGTLQARAVVPNEDKTFLPGMYVRIRVPTSPSHAGLLIPDSAIGRDQQGTYVLIVNDQDVVKRQSVQTGPLINGKRAIHTGLKSSDRVITDGLTRVSPGDTVSPTTESITPGQK